MREPISVVIPTYNGRSLLEKHLPFVLRACIKQDEIIVVDDASTDDTVSFLEHKFTNIRIIRLKKNKRFAHACNVGVQNAQHNIVFILNNDVSPEPDCIENAVTYFTNESVFGVGCAELDDSGKRSGRSIGRFVRGMIVHKRADNQTKTSTLWITGGSCFVNRAKYLELGGMDLLYSPAYEEDRALSYQALKNGWRIYFSPESQVQHQHESTNAHVFSDSYMKLVKYRNLWLFHWINLTDVSYLLQFLAWTPYHILVNGLRTHGYMFFGWLWSLVYVPRIFLRKSRRATIVSDKEIMQKFESEYT